MSIEHLLDFPGGPANIELALPVAAGAATALAPGVGLGTPINLTQWQDAVPLIDMVGFAQEYTWHGLTGGLYPGGTNTPPAQYTTDGIAAAALVEPLNNAGAPDPVGWILAVTSGMSNHRMEMCGVNVQFNWAGQNCKTGSFMKRLHSEPGTNVARFRVFNRAVSGWVLNDSPLKWETPDAQGWTGAASDIASAGRSEDQVQVLLVKNVRTFNGTSLPNASAAAYLERDGLEATVRAAMHRYPNLRQVFLWSRIYGGYSNGISGQSPEPYAFESGFAVKYLIEDYINGALAPEMIGGSPVDVPWLGWGPYLWANGMTPRSDGLTWSDSPGDLAPDHVHPSDAGISKAGGIIHDFFMASDFSPWYRS